MSGHTEAPAFYPGVRRHLFNSRRDTTMAKFRLNDLKQLHAELGGILQDYSNAKAAEVAATAAGEDDATNTTGGSLLEQKDQPGAQDAAATGGSFLDSVPGYKRIHMHHADAFAAKKSVE